LVSVAGSSYQQQQNISRKQELICSRCIVVAVVRCGVMLIYFCGGDVPDFNRAASRCCHLLDALMHD
jgi:hypothetical protein